MQWKWVVLLGDETTKMDGRLLERLMEKEISVICWKSKHRRFLRDLIRYHKEVPVIVLPPKKLYTETLIASCRLKWVSFLQDNSSYNGKEITEDIYYMNVLFIEPNNQGFYLKVPNSTRNDFETINEWENSKGFLKKVAYKPCVQKPLRSLRVVMEKHFPFYQFLEGPQQSAGSDVNLLKTLSESINFTYSIHRPSDGTWGGYNGTHWTGMISMLVNDEADIAMSGMTVTYDRYRAVVFSRPYAFDRITYVIKRPAVKLKTWAIFWPYTFQVWLWIGGSVLVMSFILTFLRNAMKSRNKHSVKLSNSAMYIFQALLTQGHYNARETRCRILMSFWWGFCITMVAGYNGSLMSFMAHPGYYPALDSLPLLIDAIKYTQFAIGTIKNSADYVVFKNSDEEDLQLILDRMDSDPRNLVHHDIEGLRESLNRDYAYVGGELTVRADIWDNKLFLFSQDSFLQYGYSIAFSPGFDHVEIFNRRILQLRESGVIKKWIEEIIERQQVRTLLKGKLIQKDEEEEAHVLRFDDVQGAFSVMSIGLLAATLSCCIENVLHYCIADRRKQKK